MDKPKLLETDSDIYKILPSELKANIKPSSDYGKKKVKSRKIN
jgi:hypothetical protein